MGKVHEVLSEKDVEDIIEMAVEFHAEVESNVTFDPDVIRSFGRMLRNDYDREDWNAYVAHAEDGTPVGFLVCKMAPYFFSRERAAYQELWYVRKEYRGTRISFDLIRAFEEWGRLRGAVQLFSGQINPEPSVGKKISRVLTRLGYPRVGTYHCKNTTEK